ncbi:MAG: thioredoxin domain-containing protein [Candidatus Saccharimonadales bacterium]
MDKRFLAIIVAIIVIFGGIILISNNNKTSKSDSTSGQPTSHFTGDLTSKVTFVEYGDYECPACESFQPTVQQVIKKYADKVKFQFRNLPLTSLHPNAFAGARASEAAALQDKFWEMHEALYDYSNWSQWSPGTTTDPTPYFWQYAKNLGLNVTKFKADYKSSAVNDKINADIAAFSKTGLPEATPTYFLNGKHIENTALLDSTSGQPSVDAFSKILDAALAKAQ